MKKTIPICVSLFFFAAAAFFRFALIGYGTVALACAGIGLCILLYVFLNKALRTVLTVVLLLGLLLFSAGEIPVLMAAGGTPDYDADWLIVLGAGVNGTVPSLSMLDRLNAARTYLLAHPDCTAQNLWQYNREFHRLYGGDTARNAGLKSALLSLPAQDVDFLFAARVVESSDLAGGGRNVNIPALLGKLRRGMKKPSAFFTVVNGLIRGGRAAKLYKKAPEVFSPDAVAQWDRSITELDLPID